jgi:hypothetical protein
MQSSGDLPPEFVRKKYRPAQWGIICIQMRHYPIERNLRLYHALPFYGTFQPLHVTFYRTFLTSTCYSSDLHNLRRCSKFVRQHWTTLR